VNQIDISRERWTKISVVKGGQPGVLKCLKIKDVLVSRQFSKI